MSHESLIQITAKTFCAGALLETEKVIKCAPILNKHILGRDLRSVCDICKKRSWDLKFIQKYKYYKYTSEETLPSKPNEFIYATNYMEIGEDLYTYRLIREFDNGDKIYYDLINSTDEYGFLPDQKFVLSEVPDEYKDMIIEIDLEEFEVLLKKGQFINFKEHKGS